MVEDGAEGDPASFMDAPQEASAAGGRSDSGTHPTPLWCMLPSEFAAAARRGRLHMATGAPPLNGSGQTALSFGESEGFSAEDIAHFYVARRTRNGAAYTEERLRLAYEDFVRDALFESKEVPPEVALRVGVITVLGPAPPRASGVVDHGGLWRPLAFISEGAAAAWLDSIDDGVRHRQGLRVASIRANDEEHFYILAGNDSA
ncbi:MAG TPA: hypothetical protein VFX49_01440 [Chloroflexota bacterium]|nr:hypothetical protein [Chloroflexota bacterium]